MPTTTFGQDKVRASATSFPKIKLALNEIARVVCMEPGPVYEWVHNLQKPKFSAIDGKPKIVWLKKKDSEEQYQDYDMEFVGTPICLGDPDVLDEKGVDPSKCPACKLSVDEDYVRPPSRRFATHVLQYSTKIGTPNLSTPFSVQTRVWSMSEGRFAQIVQVLSEFSTDGSAVDPRKIDLILGACTSANFQNYAIKAARECALIASKENLERGMMTFKENHASDLSAFCGRKSTLQYLTQDLEDITEAWSRIRTGSSLPVPDLDLANTLDSSLLDSADLPTSKGFTAPPAEEPPGTGSSLNEFRPGGSLQDVQPSTEESSVSGTKADQNDVPDFDELIKSLGIEK
jgi:hypothetical protein